MGTNYSIHLSISRLDSKPVAPAEYSAVRDILRNYDVGDIMSGNSGTLFDVGKWSWTNCMESLCANTVDLVFALTGCSEGGNLFVEYYVSQFGFAYKDIVRPKFDKTKYNAAVKTRAAVKKEEKRQEDVRRAALSKLSKEEKKALGL